MEASGARRRIALGKRERDRQLTARLVVSPKPSLYSLRPKTLLSQSEAGVLVLPVVALHVANMATDDAAVGVVCAGATAFARGCSSTEEERRLSGGGRQRSCDVIGAEECY
jgi:hypothetical protein